MFGSDFLISLAHVFYFFSCSLVAPIILWDMIKMYGKWLATRIGNEDIKLVIEGIIFVYFITLTLKAQSKICCRRHSNLCFVFRSKEVWTCESSAS